MAMTGDERLAYEDALIADMRANGGRVTSGYHEGKPLLVMTSTGARSGQPRRSILTFTRDGDDYVVAGTAGGAPTAPAWVSNVAAHPEVAVEAEGRTWTGRARVVEDGPERDRLWAQHVERLPWFAEYPEKAGRIIPMVRITPD
jgi:deazaflavin-dependent oxidoreductase (nitroreductase family)